MGFISGLGLGSLVSGLGFESQVWSQVRVSGSVSVLVSILVSLVYLDSGWVLGSGLGSWISDLGSRVSGLGSRVLVLLLVSVLVLVSGLV